MKLVRKLIVVLAVLLVLLIGAAAAAFFFVDSIARRGIESGASYALMVPTSLDKADVGVFSGSFSMQGLAIDNPEGYSRDHFLTLDSGGVQVALGTLNRSVVELPELTLTGVEVSLLREGGKSNYGTILDNLKRFESGKADPKATEPSKKFVIKRLEIRDVKAHVSLLPVGGEATTAEIVVPEIVLTDVGSDGSGVGLGEVTGIVLKAIIASLINAGGDLIPSDIANELQNGLGELASLGEMGIDMAADLGKGLENVIGDVGQEAGKAVEDAAKEAEKALKGATEGLKGILPGGGG